MLQASQPLRRGDAQAAARCLASEVEVISPLTAQFRFRGRDQATDMLAAAFEVIGEIRFHTAVGIGDTRALFYRPGWVARRSRKPSYSGSTRPASSRN
jgi:hypothetical protein